ncbi:uncharacterized protein LOC114734823 [Neltuma alba]|uniref:uncharacterized protein LOC114734823 n=1 Tax=Neltuma alba TaxID=207710 RepID=UPI0010A59368|nr:uncharacterized protein LOC114734823 [Prosopis alba]
MPDVEIREDVNGPKQSMQLVCQSSEKAKETPKSKTRAQRGHCVVAGNMHSKPEEEIVLVREAGSGLSQNREVTVENQIVVKRMEVKTPTPVLRDRDKNSESACGAEIRPPDQNTCYKMVEEPIWEEEMASLSEDNLVDAEGAGSRSFPVLIKDIVRKNKIGLFCLIEPRISGGKAEKIVRKLGFSNWIRVEATGFAGGIWLLWQDKDFEVEYKASSEQFLLCKITCVTIQRSFLGMFVYGETCYSKRNRLWQVIRAVAETVEEEWILMGDFNAYRDPSNKKGGAPPHQLSMEQFNECVNEAGLLELSDPEKAFTWEKEGLQEKIDWVFCNVAWADTYRRTKVKLDLKYKSDHKVVVIEWQEGDKHEDKSRRFHFHSAWLLEDNFQEVVEEAWRGNDWIQGAHRFQELATKWNKEKVGSIPKKKKEIMRRLEGIEKCKTQGRLNGLLRLEKRLWEEYNRVLLQEELIWYQKSRCKWLQWGDKNTRYFHATSIARRAKKNIMSLKDDNGVWVQEKGQIQQLACASHGTLTPEVSDVEIKNAAFAMGAFKAPGPDGLQPHFFQTQWNIVGGKICDFVKRAFENPQVIKEINQTNIVLVPKVENPTTLKEMRPISLCNVSYKIITKVLANRFRSVMNHLVGPQQGSFISNRSSCDNIIVAQEAIHKMRTKPGKRGYMAIKVDMEKAYDRLDWGYLQDTLSVIGIKQELIRVIMACVGTASMTVLINGEVGPMFQPSRGIRQGDPLSPYLFVLCMERLNHIILEECSMGRWRPLRFNNEAPPISHLFFADDLLLFTEASTRQVEEVKRIMKRFCLFSGHRINLEKSKAFFSRNVNINRALTLSQKLGIGITPDLGKYLGVPLIHARITKATYGHIMKRVRSRLSGWKGKHLTMAGRSVLIKSVISALPSYQMQSSLLPKGVLKEIEKLSCSFLWSQNINERKTHLIAWEKVIKNKNEGGLGIKDMEKQNKAFIMKLCWGLITKRDSLWVQCLRSIYECGQEQIPLVEKKKNISSTWKAISAIWETFMTAVGKKINSGNNTKFWWEPWTQIDKPLIEIANQHWEDINPDDRVADFILDSGTWNVQKLRYFLPEWAVKKVLQSGPLVTNQPDVICWRASNDGEFSVKSAYKYLSNTRTGAGNRFWRSLWRWQVPEKVKFFMWHVFHERVMTNSLRTKRGLSDRETCPFGCNSEESVIHLLRDCYRAKQVWKAFIHPNSYTVFFSGDLQEWIHWNVEREPKRTKFPDVAWNRVFGILCWLIWKCRCQRIFQTREAPVKEIIHQCNFLLLEGVEDGKWKHRIFNNQQLESSQWVPPEEGSVRVDVDASVLENGQAACGGVIRDEGGRWIAGFKRGLGVLPSTIAELLAIHTGLEVCRSLNLPNIQLCSDSLEAINMLARPNGGDHPFYNEIEEVKSLLYEWHNVRIGYSNRDSIGCADNMARTGHQVGLRLVIVPEVDPACRERYMEDRKFLRRAGPTTN